MYHILTLESISYLYLNHRILLSNGKQIDKIIITIIMIKEIIKSGFFLTFARCFGGSFVI